MQEAPGELQAKRCGTEGEKIKKGAIPCSAGGKQGHDLDNEWGKERRLV